MSYRIVFTRQAQRDAKKLKNRALKEKADQIINILRGNPFQNPPAYEKLTGYLSGAYSKRINIQHRLVYQVIEEEMVVKVIRMWTHYGR